VGIPTEGKITTTQRNAMLCFLRVLGWDRQSTHMRVRVLALGHSGFFVISTGGTKLYACG